MPEEASECPFCGNVVPARISLCTRCRAEYGFHTGTLVVDRQGYVKAITLVPKISLGLLVLGGILYATTDSKPGNAATFVCLAVGALCFVVSGLIALFGVYVLLVRGPRWYRKSLG